MNEAQLRAMERAGETSELVFGLPEPRATALPPDGAEYLGRYAATADLDVRTVDAAPSPAVAPSDEGPAFSTPHPLLNDLLNETWWMAKGKNNHDTVMAWGMALQLFLDSLASTQPSADGAVEAERTHLRAEQTTSVMPQIGPLLDAWEGIDNDTKGLIREQAPALSRSLGLICRAMEGSAAEAAEQAAVTAQINEQDESFVDATFRAPKLCEYALRASRDGLTSNWYIEVTDEGGFHLYDGYWRDSARKSRAEVLVEAAHGANLGVLAAPGAALAAREQDSAETALRKRLRSSALATIGGLLSVSGKKSLRHLETNLDNPRGAGVHIASGKDEKLLEAICEVVNQAIASPDEAPAAPA